MGISRAAHTDRLTPPQIPIACPEQVTAKLERVELVPLVKARDLLTQPSLIPAPQARDRKARHGNAG